MNKNNRNEPLCISVFKSGKNTMKSQFTQKWIALINRMEKSKLLKNK